MSATKFNLFSIFLERTQMRLVLYKLHFIFIYLFVLENIVMSFGLKGIMKRVG
jgi:hypothetical protein